MTYSKNAKDAGRNSALETHDICMCCGEPASGPTVAYDLVITSGLTARALFHRDCAFAMAQRIICDAWPNRRDGELMRTDR